MQEKVNVHALLQYLYCLKLCYRYMLENGNILSPDSVSYIQHKMERVSFMHHLQTSTTYKDIFATFGLHNVVNFQLLVLIQIFHIN